MALGRDFCFTFWPSCQSDTGQQMQILHVAGARPNFVKAAPVLRAIKKRAMLQTLVHTGQHYDQEIEICQTSFLRSLKFPSRM
jgi:UDP-N-acetylglucosamine 2-epimerase (non-hydrolysing)